MKPNKNSKRQPSKADVVWAGERVKDLVSGCVLNIILKNGGVCEKYLFEMSEKEVLEYYQMIFELYDVKKKFTS